MPKPKRGAIDPKFKSVLRSPLSTVKMDLKDLEKYMKELNKFLKDPGMVALRVCECCANVT